VLEEHLDADALFEEAEVEVGVHQLRRELRPVLGVSEGALRP
jgi:hypothetical protein